MIHSWAWIIYCEDLRVGQHSNTPSCFPFGPLLLSTFVQSQPLDIGPESLSGHIQSLSVVF